VRFLKTDIKVSEEYAHVNLLKLTTYVMHQQV